MAHTDSIQHSVQDLTGKPSVSMSIVRQKEANLVIRWLQHAVPKYLAGVKANPSAGQLPDENLKEEATLSSQGARARSTVGFAAQIASVPADIKTAQFRSLGNWSQKQVRGMIEASEGDKLQAQVTYLGTSHHSRAVQIAGLFQTRCDNFDCQL